MNLYAYAAWLRNDAREYKFVVSVIAASDEEDARQLAYSKLNAAEPWPGGRTIITLNVEDITTDALAWAGARTTNAALAEEIEERDAAKLPVVEGAYIKIARLNGQVHALINRVDEMDKFTQRLGIDSDCHTDQIDTVNEKVATLTARLEWLVDRVDGTWTADLK